MSSIFDIQAVKIDSSGIDSIVDNDYTTIPSNLKVADVSTVLNKLVSNLKNEQNGNANFISKTQAQTITATHNFVNGATGITKSHIGLGNVSNLSPANLPISTATQTALDGLSSDINLKANINGPTFTGNPRAPTQTQGDNSTKLATTAYVDTGLNLKADLAGPTFTGNPRATTQPQGDNSTKLATTAYCDTGLDLKANKTYVDNNFLSLGSGSQVIGGTKTFNNVIITSNEINSGNFTVGNDLTDIFTINATTSVNNVNLTPSQISKLQYLDVPSSLNSLLNAKANLSSANTFTGSNSFQGTTTGITQSQGDNSTKICTTEYCDLAVSNLVNSAPSTLNTLQELANSINNDSSFSTTMVNNLASKSGLTSNNNFSGLNNFTQLPTYQTTDNLINKSYVDNNFLSLGSGSQVIGGTKTFNNVIITGNEINSGNFTVGNDLSDTFTINATTKVNNVNIIPSKFANLQHLDINSGLTNLLDAKAGLSTNNTFSGNNTYSGSSIYNGVSLSASQMAKGQYIDISSSLTGLLNNKANLLLPNNFQNTNTYSSGSIYNGVNLSPSQMANIQYLDVSSSVNTQLTDTNNKIREYLPSLFNYGLTATSLINTFTPGSPTFFINFSDTSLKIDNVIIELSFGFTQSKKNDYEVLKNNAGYGIYSLNLTTSANNTTNFSIIQMQNLISGLSSSSLLSSQSYIYDTGINGPLSINYHPFTFSALNQQKIKCEINFPITPSNSAPLCNQSFGWISNIFASCRIISSKPNTSNNRMINNCINDLSNTNYLNNSAVGSAYISLS